MYLKSKIIEKYPCFPTSLFNSEGFSPYASPIFTASYLSKVSFFNSAKKFSNPGRFCPLWITETKPSLASAGNDDQS